MKYTLLEMTQAVLRSIKGEEVSNITDTQESIDVARIIKECYYGIISVQDFPELKSLFQLTASGDNDLPCYMTVPTNVLAIDWLRYDKRINGETKAQYEDVQYLPLHDFLKLTQNLNPEDDDVFEMEVTIQGNTHVFRVRNNRAPTYYTSYNDDVLIFDSYDAEVSTTLEASKTSAFGLIEPTWTESNSFVPTLDAQQFDILIKEAKAMAWQELKSIENRKAELQARKGHIKAEAKKHRVNYKRPGAYYEDYPNYGRK